MKMIEIHAVVEAGGVIRLPEAERKVMGIEAGIQDIFRDRNACQRGGILEEDCLETARYNGR